MIEVWKDIPDFKGFYQISNLGRVKSLDRYAWNGKVYHKVKSRILKNILSGNGYYQVFLHKHGDIVNRRIHQLVAISFLSHDITNHKLVVDHINFNKLDNKVSNLRVVSIRENTSKKNIKSSSEYTGVHYDKPTGKWMSRILLGKRRKYLGLFTNELQAHFAYQDELYNITKETVEND